ncbi:hypothetical protein [Niabella drilacis]|uniref:CCDC81-like prokaryotic HU domain-containing protein n=1 Tax=Niabella drilacis (strain DSM 25811 / CCM 8410 / CCUG 62505 / LMG 26954 / E90) TaxID=1285928 RepID=A0A1G6Z2V9_NIADE|nr:hypothetical protein [Niabella drilacis]SDD96195.1 hypothetical protein SAMN04487894_11711 [Niabella drilacis]
MFPILSAYLYQEKKITIPGIGRFELIPVNAATGFETVEAPGWEIRFTENQAAESNENPEGLFTLLGSKEAISRDESRIQFEEFARNILVKLNDQEIIEWENVGVLEKPDALIVFTPRALPLSPFTGIAAQKVLREHAAHPVLIGEKETSLGAAKEQLQELQTGKNKSKKTTWIVLAAVIVIATLFFLKNGCSLQSAANQQQVPVQKPEPTYKQP